MEIGERIKKLRTEKGMTQEELGEFLGVGKATVQKYETNQIQNLKTSHIRKLCQIFDRRPYYFIYDDTMINTEMLDEIQIVENVELIFGKCCRDILVNAGKLNVRGQNKALEYISDALEIEKYKKR